METSVLNRLDSSAGQYADRVIFKDESSSLTFRQFNDLTRSIGTCLAKLLPLESPVVVMSGRHSLTPACFLGVVRAGCFYAPMDGEMPLARLKQILSVIQAPVMLVDRAHLDIARSLEYESTILVVEDILNTDIDEQLLQDRQKNLNLFSPLYVIFSSGSTGAPKGVITSHFSLMNYIDAVGKVLDIGADDVIGCQAPLDYIAAIRDIYFPISFGARTCILPKKEFANPIALFETLNREKVTTLCWSVAGVELPAKLGAFDLCKPKYLKKLCFSGSVISSKYLRIWQDALPDVLYVNQYGPTEATASCTYFTVSDKVNEDTVLPIGRPYDNYKILLLNDDNTPTAPGEIGQICVGGAGVTLGYYGNREKTDSSFIQNPLNGNYREILYKTGDLGRWVNGNLEFHGRMDRQIKHMGHRIELGEIEDTAKGIPGVEDCCALYHAEKEALYLFYTGSATAREIAVAFRAELPSFMVPRKMIRLDALPTLPNGKTDMQSLKKMFI